MSLPAVYAGTLLLLLLHACCSILTVADIGTHSNVTSDTEQRLDKNTEDTHRNYTVEGDILTEMHEYVGDVHNHHATKGRVLQQLRQRWRSTGIPKFGRNWGQKTSDHDKRGGQVLAEESYIFWFQGLLNSTLPSFHSPVGRTSSSHTTGRKSPDTSLSKSRGLSNSDAMSTSSTTSRNAYSSRTAVVPPRMSRRVVTVEPGYMLVVKSIRLGQPHDTVSMDDLSFVSETEEVELNSEEKHLKNVTIVNDTTQTVLESSLTSQSSETLEKAKDFSLESFLGSQHNGIVPEVSTSIPTESRNASKGDKVNGQVVLRPSVTRLRPVAGNIKQTERADTAEDSAAIVTKITDLHEPVSPSGQSTATTLLVADLPLTTGVPAGITVTDNEASSVTMLPLKNHSISQKLEAATVTQVTSLPRQQGVTVHRHRRQVDPTDTTTTSGSEPTESTTTYSTELPSYVLAKRKLGESCGYGSSTWGYCYLENSACTFQKNFWDMGERECQCIHNTFMVEDDADNKTCVEVPSQLFHENISITLSSDTADSTSVYNSSLDFSGVEMTSVEISYTLYPSNSFLLVPDVTSTNFTVQTIGKLPDADSLHFFFLRVDVHDEMNDWLSTDIMTLNITVRRVFPSAAPIVDIFLLDGSLKETIVYDVTSALGNVDNTELKLLPESGFALFQLQSKRRIVCVSDVNINNLRTSSNTIGHVMTLNLTSSGQVVLTLKVAVIVASSSISVNENNSPGWNLVTFSSLLESFDVTGQNFPVNIPLKLSLTDAAVQLTRGLDFETDPKSFSFTITARSHRDSSLSTLITATVSVTDQNDSPPTFLSEQYVFTALYGSDQGTLLGRLTVDDQDSLPQTFTFRILPSQNSSLFQIRDSVGLLEATKKLPQDAGPNGIVIQVSVSDGSHTSTQSATVTIFMSSLKEDLELVGGTHSVSVVENTTAVGTAIFNASLSNYTGYQLLPPVITKFFFVNQTTGIISTLIPIDREDEGNRPPENFVVVGYHKDDVCKLKMVSNISITILDVNDNAPVFVSVDYIPRIPENSATGTSVFKFSATDKDYLENATLTYRITGGNSILFSIDSVTGLLTVNDSAHLDREVMETVRLMVTVTDGGTTLQAQYRLSATVNFTVTLVDVNDNDPVFNQSFYSFNVLENVTIGLEVAVVMATDRDVGLNGEIRYSISDGAYGFFSINDTTGVLRTSRRLDRETQASYNITVMASDRGSPPRSSSVIVTVILQDVNDNSPQFQTQIYLPSIIDEGTNCSNTSFVRVKAEDKDFGTNSEIVYSIDSDLLNINPATGEVTCKPSGLDYENVTQRVFDVVVRATDKGTPPLSGNSTIRVTVRDVNDNSPTFFNSPYNVSVRIETFDTVDNPVFVISVQDRDSGENRELDFKLINAGQGEPDLFAVDNAVLRVNRTGRPLLRKYSYTVVVTDRGRPPLTGSALLEVHIDDTGTNVVTFRQKNVDFQAVEETAYTQSLGKAIGQLKATVTVQNQSSPLNYSIVGKSSFEVNSTTGQLFSIRVWDRERDKDSSDLTLWVKASFRDYLDYALVQVKLLDINDNAPTILTPQPALIVSVGEDAEEGTFVASLSASDPDEAENGTVVFSMEPGQPFRIETENSTGKIRVNGTLDREQRAEYVVTVTVRDNASTPETRKTVSTTVTIDIKDVNDNPPIFVALAQIFVSENTNLSTKVGYVNATDADNGVNATLTYSVVNEKTCPVGIVDESASDNGNIGRLSLRETLDYETQTSYTCLIQATDLGPAPLTSSANLIIYVTDVNDNAPVIHSDSISINMSRDVNKGYVLVDSLNATDADSGNNGAIVFSFVDPGDETYSYFSIDPTTGAVSVLNSLWDFPQDAASISVVARDTPVGTPQLISNIMQIQVNLSDHSTRPTFGPFPDNLSITEGQLQSSLATLTAFVYVNKVKVDNCNCSYAIGRIVPDNGSLLQNTFEMNSMSGELSLVKSVDREATGNSIALTLLVSDYGTPPKTGTATLTIKVVDVNDESPKFNTSFLELNVTESLCNGGHFLYNITAHDADWPPNNVVVYRVRQQYPEQRVTINNSSGQLSLPCPVEYDTTIIATVEAADKLDPEKHNSVDLRINVLAKDPNPHAPSFVNQGSVYQSSVPYTAAKGYTLSIVNFNATDEDASQSIAYSVVSGNVRDLFTFDSTSLSFTLQYDIDKTIPPVLNITVKATDQGNFSPSYRKTATATLVVTVSGESTPCYNASDVAALSSQAEKSKLYQGLFIAIVVLLAIAILLCVIFVYKWRAAVSEAKSRRSSDYTAQTQQLTEPANTTVTNLSEAPSGANTSGFPPELPKRTGGAPHRNGQNSSGESGFASMPYGSDPSWDSGGYLRPSERGDSDTQYPVAHYEDHESLEPGEPFGNSAGYIPGMGQQPPRHQFHKPGSAGFHDVASPENVYIHPVSEREDHGTYLRTSTEPQASRGEPSGTYLRVQPGPNEKGSPVSLASILPGLNAGDNNGKGTNATRDTSDDRRGVGMHEIPRARLARPSHLGFPNRAYETQFSPRRPGNAVRFPGYVQPQAMYGPVSEDDLPGSRA